MVAQSAAAANGAEAKRTRTKAADLDTRVEYKDAKNQRSKSMPQDVHSLVVIDKANKEVEFSLREIPPAELIKAAAKTLRLEFKNLKAKDGPVLDQAAEIFTATKSGKLFTREAGAKGGPGRAFDATHIHEAVVRAYNWKQEKAGKKPLAAKDVANLLVQIKAYSAADRKKAVDTWKKDSVVSSFYKTIAAERSAAALSSASGSAEDLLKI